jgi:hypothetical protein
MATGKILVVTCQLTEPFFREAFDDNDAKPVAAALSQGHSSQTQTDVYSSLQKQKLSHE